MSIIFVNDFLPAMAYKEYDTLTWDMRLRLDIVPVSFMVRRIYPLFVVSCSVKTDVDSAGDEKMTKERQTRIVKIRVKERWNGITENHFLPWSFSSLICYRCTDRCTDHRHGKSLKQSQMTQRWHRDSIRHRHRRRYYNSINRKQEKEKDKASNRKLTDRNKRAGSWMSKKIDIKDGNREKRKEKRPTAVKEKWQTLAEKRHTKVQ